MKRLDFGERLWGDDQGIGLRSLPGGHGWIPVQGTYSGVGFYLQ